MTPYTDINRSDLEISRIFDSKIESEDLMWHRDLEDRILYPVGETDWMIQMDNELPIELKKGDEIFIPKYTYHRVFKGRTPLVIEITELD